MVCPGGIRQGWFTVLLYSELPDGIPTVFISADMTDEDWNNEFWQEESTVNPD